MRPLTTKPGIQPLLKGGEPTGTLNNPLILGDLTHYRIINQRLNGCRGGPGTERRRFFWFRPKQNTATHEKVRWSHTGVEQHNPHAMGDFGGKQSSHVICPLAMCPAHNSPT